ncbi:MAG: hypothetical protein M0P59_03760 [Gallionella sp.]|jgi:hypothetical protein|nr:hypothetical protein [Gallionella sp.]MCK9353255.1 hypothetical protein [Gallionella sp.]
MKTMNRHSGAGRNPVEKIARVADKTEVMSRFAGNHSIGWIPACAGMTQLLNMVRNNT